MRVFHNTNWRLIALSSVVFFFMMISCKKSNLEPTNLLPYGLPITIDAPKDAEIEADNYAMQKGVNISGPDNYSILVTQSPIYASVDSVVAGQKQFVTENPYFTSFLLEEASGFIYKIQVDTAYVNYNFRHVKRFGDMEYSFQAGIAQQYTEEQIRHLYSIAQGAQ